MSAEHLHHHDWSLLDRTLRHAYRGQVCHDARCAESLVPHYACYRMVAGTAALSDEAGAHTGEPGDWLLCPADRKRFQHFHDPASIVSLCFRFHWPNERGAIAMPGILRVTGGDARRLDTAADDVCARATSFFSTTPVHVVRFTADGASYLALSIAVAAFQDAWCATVRNAGATWTPARPADPRVDGCLPLLDPKHCGLVVPYAALGARSGLSRSQLDRLFLQELGYSPKKSLEGRCLSAVQHALHDGNAPIKAIAHRFGFTDAAHLTRWFKQRCGRTPRAYRVDPAV